MDDPPAYTQDHSYIICRGSSIQNLVVNVNSYMTKGYIPQGGVAFVEDSTLRRYYIQSMILKDLISR